MSVTEAPQPQPQQPLDDPTTPNAAGFPALPARLLHPGLLLAGIVLVALNMRACLAAVSPLVDEMQRSFGLSSTAGGLITAVPVLFQGVGAPLTPRLVRRHGTERVVLGAVLLLASGILLRVLPSAAALYAGCVVIGVAIAVLNVAIPGLIKGEFPQRAAAMTGVYSTSMLVGATLAAAVSVPLEQMLGGWQASLGFWSVPALAAAVGWLPRLLRRPAGAPTAGAPTAGTATAGTATTGTATAGAAETARTGAAAAPPVQVVAVWRSGLAWQISAFMGISSLLVYSLVAWLPTILVDAGMKRGEAGLVFAFSTLVQVVGAFAVPVAAGRMRSQRGLAVAMAALNAIGIAGLLAAPAAGAWVWALVLGVAQGGSLGLALSFIVLRSGGAGVAAQLSGMTQTVGYLVAAAGPVTAGALHQATGSWTLPLALMLLLCAVAGAAGLGSGRDRVLGGRTPR